MSKIGPSVGASLGSSPFSHTVSLRTIYKIFPPLTTAALSDQPTLRTQAVSAMVIANSSHLFSVLILYNLSRSLISSSLKLRLTCAALHIIAPAGLFMSAPFAESLFSFLHFTGLLLYCKANENRRAVDDWLLPAAGLFVGLSSAVRSNGVFTGVVFAIDFLSAILRLRNVGPRRAFALLLAGLLIGAGFILPQAIAYHHFCIEHGSSDGRRPWCDSKVPGIYTFVQSHYWLVDAVASSIKVPSLLTTILFRGNGFLRYWTVSNLPLFLLAAPTIALLLVSATSYIDLETFPLHETSRKADSKSASADLDMSRRRCLSAIALPQLLLATVAVTVSHVQIITRIATGYPLPYIWITSALVDRRQIKLFGRHCEVARLIIYWMVMYGVVQGGLYASFLPPA